MRRIIFSIVVLIIIGIAGFYFINRINKVTEQQTFPDLEIEDVVEKQASEYKRYIFTKNTSESYLLKMIKEYDELSSDDNSSYLSFELSNSGEWWIIKVGETVDFYTYHNLVGWFHGYEKNIDTPTLSIGFAKNEADPEKDYIFYLDPRVNAGDTAIGSFRNDKSFYIYLPDASEMNELIVTTNQIDITFDDFIKKTITNNGLDISKLDSLNYTEHKIKIEG